LLLFSCCCPTFWPAAVAEERAPASDPQTHRDRTSEELAKLYDAVVETIDQKFFDEALLKQLDWRARAQAVRASVLSTPTTEDGIRQINALLSELKTSHTALFTPNDYEYYILLDVLGASPDSRDLLSRRFWGTGPYYAGIGIFTRQIDGRRFVDGILEGSPADRAGLKHGDEVLSVDDMPYSAVAAFRGKIGTTVELQISTLFDCGAAAPASFRRSDTADAGVFRGDGGERASHRTKWCPHRICPYLGSA
jgi:carboxyl-terminal processing protease